VSDGGRRRCGNRIMSVLAALYPWTKALHIIAIIAWMAGLLYLPRLFVYHADALPGSPMSETFKVMERRLLKAIMGPAMHASVLLGILLLLTPGIVDWSAGWIYAKLASVAGLLACHVLMGKWRKEFAADANRRPARFYRIVNEIPTLLLIGIVIFVVVKPF
jgi:protoporphyrinogen IX oxidase